MKLYDIAEGIEAILASIDEETGELTEEQAHELDKLDMAFAEKVEAVAMFIRNKEAAVNACNAEAARLTAKAHSAKNRVEWCKRYLMDILDLRGMTTAKGRVLSIGIQNSTPHIVVDDSKAIPADFWVAQEPKLSGAELLAALKEGAVPGAHIEQGRHVRIR